MLVQDLQNGMEIMDCPDEEFSVKLMPYSVATLNFYL
jgi:hypothetical protein